MTQQLKTIIMTNWISKTSAEYKAEALEAKRKYEQKQKENARHK